MKDIEKNIP